MRRSEMLQPGRLNPFDYIYRVVEEAGAYGIGNCTQTTRRITEALSTGRISPVKFRERFPGYTTGREIDSFAGMNGEQLLNTLQYRLREGQHCQVSADMSGAVKKAFGIGHVFNAIKIEGKIRLIDTYKGWSKNSWLNASWNNPEVFLQSFENFYISTPENSIFAWKDNPDIK